MKEGIDSFNCVVDYRDVGNVDMLKLINEKALMQDSDQIKEAYMFDYLLQVNLTAINGMAYIESSDDK